MSFKFDTNEKIVNSLINNIFGSIHFWIQNEMDIYERLYKKVQDPNMIGKLSGHVEGSRAFARYRTIDDEMKKKLVSMLE